jgi:hypothetical protein
MKVYAPASVKDFKPRVVASSSWMNHVCFCYDLVDAIQPGLLVELGTGQAMSYFAFCQSMKDHAVDGLCYAVDPWQSQNRADPQDDAAFQEIDDYNRRHFPSFSYLMRMRVEAALSHFSDGAIDLLNIDGMRLGGEVVGVVNGWMAKVKPGGIVLLHGATQRDGNVAIASVWDEISTQRPSFLFSHGRGLGMIRKSGDPDTPSNNHLLSLLFDRHTDAREQLQQFYEFATQFQILKHKFAASRFGQRKQRPAKVITSSQMQ